MQTICEKNTSEMKMRFYVSLFLFGTFIISYFILKFYGVVYPPCPPCTICPHSSGWQAVLESVEIVSAICGIMNGLIALLIWVHKYEVEHEK